MAAEEGPSEWGADGKDGGDFDSESGGLATAIPKEVMGLVPANGWAPFMDSALSLSTVGVGVV